MLLEAGSVTENVTGKGKRLILFVNRLQQRPAHCVFGLDETSIRIHVSLILAVLLQNTFQSPLQIWNHKMKTYPSSPTDLTGESAL